MPVKSGRLRRLAKLSGLAAGLVGDAAGTLSSRGSAMAHRRAAERLANVLGDMKGLPQKVGQIMSVLDDALPVEHRQMYAEVLGRLQAHVQPLPWDELRGVVEADLGVRTEDIFSAVDSTPAAAASIGQVHRAWLPDGRSVAVKVQYPGVAQALRGDLDNVGLLVGALSMVFSGPVAADLVHEVSERFAEELDYRHEAQAQLAFAADWSGSDLVSVPHLLPELCGDRVLVSEWVDGLTASQAQVATPQLRASWSWAIWHFCWRSVLGHGCLHGDPHPGNFIFRPDGGLVVLDFGCTQRLAASTVDGLRQVADVAVRGGRQAELMAPLCMALGLPGRLPADVEKHLDAFARVLMVPISEPQPFLIDDAYREHIMQTAMAAKLALARQALLRGVPAPQARGTIMLMRTSVGVSALLARLHARADFLDATGLD